MQIDVLIDLKTILGEGPLWDMEQQRLYFIDSTQGFIYRCTADGGEVRSWDVPGKIGSMALRADGNGAICALENGFHTLDFSSGKTELIIDPEPDSPLNRLNDGKVDRRGRFFCGSMDTSEDGPNGALYRLDPDLSLHEIDDGIIVSNGPCWSPDNATFYFADSWSGEIRAYDYDIETGTASNRRTFTTLDAKIGAPDGSTVDAQGYLWNAQCFDGCIKRYSPDGQINRVVEMPVCKVTSVNFGGPGMDTLFVTSMAKPPLPRFPGDGPLRGSVFAITGLGVQGIPEPRFGS